MTERLRAREILVRTYTELGPVYSVEPGGREIPVEIARAWLDSQKLIPADDTMFPDAPPQTWRKKPRVRLP